MSWRRGLFLGAAGLLAAACFPPFDLPWPLLVLAIAAWYWGSAGLGAGASILATLVFSWPLYLLLLRWMIVVGFDAWIALSLLQALLVAPIGLLRRMTGERAWAPWVAALAWPASDWVRDHADPLAFGWGQWAFANVDAPWAHLLPLSNQWVVSGVAALAGTLLGHVLLARPPLRVAAAGTLILVLALPLLLTRDVAQTPGSGPRVFLVQGGVDHIGLGYVGDPRDVMYRHARTTERLSAADADLVLWPENSVDVDPYRDERARTTLIATSARVGAPLLVGALLDDGRERRNASVLVEGSRLTTVYVKQRLVPFGEVMPLRSTLERWFERVALVPRDFVGGTAPGRLTVGGRQLGIVICFEVADEGLVREATAGADALLVQTNNATYAGWGQSEQQLRIAQVRARTLQLPVLVVSTTGPTAIIGPDGRLQRLLVEGDVGALSLELVAARVGQ